MQKRSVQRAVSQCSAWNAREGASLSLVSYKAFSSCFLALKSAEKHQKLRLGLMDIEAGLRIDAAE